nr:hypothetical protein CFP56_35795 [Quercus suber]
MYSCGENSVTLQKVLRTDLMFQDREFTDLPLHIKLLLDNLQEAFTLKQKDLFQKTLQALELHLVSTGAFIEALGCQLPSKEDGDSSSTKIESQSLKSYLMGTSFSKLHPKILVSTAFTRTEDMTGDAWLSHKATWYESFGDADRVYERTGDRYDPYSGLLINTETEDLVIRDPLWLSEMLEAGFISKF